MDSHFQVVVLGTGLTESIAAAAFAKADLKVAHIDVNSYYGADEASLSTKELHEVLSGEAKEKIHTPKYHSTSIHGELPTSSRDYSISLSPSMIPSRGSLISALIGSGVARYGGFKLLESISVYSADGFKNVPGSKEEIFKSKELSLIDKRRLMRFLMFANGEFESSSELQGKENTGFVLFLREIFLLNEQLALALAYALALCKTTADPTLPALERIRRYLRSAGRYGPSPFLVGQYGGLGELAQGFCRVCAVSGGTYILGRDILSIESKQASSEPNESNFRLKLSDISEELTTDIVVSSSHYLPHFEAFSGHEEQHDNEIHAHCIALIDGTISRSLSRADVAEQSDDAEDQQQESGNENEDKTRVLDAALLVFPPGELASGKASGPVNVLINGEGTLSCPRGKSILYLSTTLFRNSEAEEHPNSEQVLRPYLDATLPLLRTLEGSPLKELSTAFYINSTPSISSSQYNTLKERGIVVSLPLPDHLAEAGDAAASNAEVIFRDVLRKIGRENAEQAEFWPPLPPGVDDDDDIL